jgi:hypothetical protein
MNTAQEAFHLIIAFQAKQKLECRDIGQYHWSAVINPVIKFLDFNRYEFRIAVPKVIGQNKASEVQGLIAAFRAGKYIECIRVNSPEDDFGWSPAIHLPYEPFNFEKFKYRAIEFVDPSCVVTPEGPKLREFWINEYPDTSKAVHTSAENAKKYLTPGGKTTHLVEVCDEPQKLREFWISEYPDGERFIHTSKESSEELSYKHAKTIHVVEKI